MTKKPPPASILFEGEDVFIAFDGMTIAKRGRPGTPQAKTWISLEPGYIVTTNTDFSILEVRYNGVRIH